MCYQLLSKIKIFLKFLEDLLDVLLRSTLMALIPSWDGTPDPHTGGDQSLFYVYTLIS